MKHTYLILLLAGLVSCREEVKKQAVATVDPKILVNCEGIGQVKLSDSYESLEKKFGKVALSEHENNKAGKFTTIWENQPEQINIFWNETSQPYKTIKYMEATDAMSPYMTIDSIGVGMSLRDLVRKNGNLAITFTNIYASDNPGKIRDFGNGDIPKKNPCFEGSLEWKGQKPIDATEMQTFTAKEEVKSFDRILERIDVVLSRLRVSAKK